MTRTPVTVTDSDSASGSPWHCQCQAQRLPVINPSMSEHVRVRVIRACPSLSHHHDDHHPTHDGIRRSLIAPINVQVQVRVRLQLQSSTLKVASARAVPPPANPGATRRSLSS
eukprot:3597263-Rhodomonas_salina.1